MALPNDIAIYIGHFKRENSKLGQVAERLHRKMLAVTMLGALAEGRYPTVKGDGDKFTQLIEHHSGWAYSRSISASMLAKSIATRGTIVSGALTSALSNYWQVGRLENITRGLTVDPTEADILPRNATDAERKLVRSFRHSSLLYTYRCKLVHEFRVPGHPHEFTDSDDEPIYRHDELVYPTNWLLELIPPILVSLETHYLQSATNPYDSYNFGSPWK